MIELGIVKLQVKLRFRVLLIDLLTNDVMHICYAVRKSQTAYYGDDVHLNCTTSHEVYVDWMYNEDFLYVNGQIDESLRSKYSVNRSVDGQYTLVIKKMTAAEAGVYKCIDNAGSGPELITYVLTVTGNRLTVLTFYAVIHFQLPHYGDTVRLNCATPTALHVTWMHNIGGQVAEFLHSKYSVETTFTPYRQSTLVMKNVTAAKAGVYKCIDRNESGTVLVSYNLTVTGYIDLLCDISLPDLHLFGLHQ